MCPSSTDHWTVDFVVDLTAVSLDPGPPGPLRLGTVILKAQGVNDLLWAAALPRGKQLPLKEGEVLHAEGVAHEFMRTCVLESLSLEPDIGLSVRVRFPRGYVGDAAQQQIGTWLDELADASENGSSWYARFQLAFDLVEGTAGLHPDPWQQEDRLNRMASARDCLLSMFDIDIE